MEFKTIRSQFIYQGRVFSVRKDQVSLPDGSETSLDIVDHNNAVTILPVDDEGQIWFVRQYRHPAGIEILELPAGGVETGEIPAECAQREIREEIGMGAQHLEKIGEFYLAPGYSTELMHVFLATSLFESPLEGDEDEFLQIERFSLKEVQEKIKRGEILDSKTLSAFQLAASALDGLLSQTG